MKMLKLKATTASLDYNSAAIGLQGSFVAEAEQFSDNDYNGMIDSWICIEDEKEVLDAICEEEIEGLESDAKPAANDDAADDDEPEPDPMEVCDESNTFSYVEAVDSLQKIKQKCF